MSDVRPLVLLLAAALATAAVARVAAQEVRCEDVESIGVAGVSRILRRPAPPEGEPPRRGAAKNDRDRPGRGENAPAPPPKQRKKKKNVGWISEA